MYRTLKHELKSNFHHKFFQLFIKARLFQTNDVVSNEVLNCHSYFTQNAAIFAVKCEKLSSYYFIKNISTFVFV